MERAADPGRAHRHPRGVQREIGVDPRDARLAVAPVDADLLPRRDEETDVGTRLDSRPAPGDGHAPATVVVVVERPVFIHSEGRSGVVAELRVHDPIPGIDHPERLPSVDRPVRHLEADRVLPVEGDLGDDGRAFTPNHLQVPEKVINPYVRPGDRVPRRLVGGGFRGAGEAEERLGENARKDEERQWLLANAHGDLLGFRAVADGACPGSLGSASVR